MRSARDPDMLIRAYLDDGLDELPDRSYDAVRTAIDQTRQWTVIGPWKEPQIMTATRFAMIAAAIAVMAVVALKFLPTGVGPGATIIPTPVVTPAPTINGRYSTSFTKTELAQSPLLADQDEINDGNWGNWVLTFDGGRVSYTQTNNVANSSSSGNYAVEGTAVTLAFTQGANAGETFAFRWRVDGDVLTFMRDDSLGLPGPTPFLVKSWSRTSA